MQFEIYFFKTNRPQLGGEENPSTKEQWIIPLFFEDYLFNKIFDWESIPCSADPLYTACREPDDLLTMNLELNHIPRLGTCRGDFAPTFGDSTKELHVLTCHASKVQNHMS